MEGISTNYKAIGIRLRKKNGGFMKGNSHY